MSANTLFLRLEGPLQAWGDTSKFIIRRCMEAPTKSGVLGLICAALGLSRRAATATLPDLNRLAMAVRIDRPGSRQWDWHTVGARIGILTAAGEVKKNPRTGEYETLVTRREYLADASFLVALQGDPELIARVADALASPRWALYLGRKCCPPSAPVFAQPGSGESWTNPASVAGGLVEALRAVPWRPQFAHKDRAKATLSVAVLVEWRAAHQDDVAPAEAEVWYDVPVSFDPPVHQPRLLLRSQVEVPVGRPIHRGTPPPPRPRADYANSQYKDQRSQRLRVDHYLCVFCKMPATTVQHVTYRRAGGGEQQGDLRALCRLCHDAVTMIEYGLGMGLDRINPEDPRWRDRIIQKREEIIKARSLEERRRWLQPSEVE
ncbi:MAG: type I-E CRISPR-associated protein Cas5/CasD [Thermoguttaceae bacterium]